MKKKFLSLVLACALTVGSLPYAVYADEEVNTNVPQVVATEGVTNTTHHYGIVDGGVFQDADHDGSTYWGIQFKGDNTIYSISSSVANTIKSNYLLIYTLDEDIVTPVKYIPHKTDIISAGLTCGEVSNVTASGFNTLSNAWTFADDMVVYILDETTGKFTNSTKVDISNGDYVYIGEAASNEIKLLILDGYEHVLGGGNGNGSVGTPEVAVTGVTLSDVNVDLNVGATKTLTATVSPDNATNKKVTWSSDNPAVATVDENGKITAVAPGGPVNITATTEDGSFSASAGVTVYQPAKSITLEKTSLKLAPNEGFELHYTLNPTNSTDSVTWTSSNEDVVTVDSSDYGWVQAVAEGTATLTATTDSGKTATCVVTVAPHLADFVVTVNGKDTGYDSFAEAWAAAIATSGSTLTLNENVDSVVSTLEVVNTTLTINSRDCFTQLYEDFATFTGTELIKVGEGGTLNLNGHLFVCCTNSNTVKVDGGTLNINGAEVGSQSGQNVTRAITINNNGVVNLNSGSLFEYPDYTTSVEAVLVEGGTLNIKGGSVAYDSQKLQEILLYNGTVNMTSGEVDKINVFAIDEDYVAKANISGGTLGVLAMDENSHRGTQSATITGGTFDFDPTDYVPTSGYTITQNSLYGGSLYTWTVTKKSSGGGGGGGSSSNKKDDTTKTDTKTDEVKTDEVKTEEKTETTTPAVAPGEATTENISQVFPDTKSDDWYSEAAAYAYNNGLMKGNGDGSFGANDSATRGQIVTILHRLVNEPETSSSDFNDIGGSEYYAEGVAWAAEMGIVNGYEDGTFGANGEVTREELATILYRFAKSQDKLGDVSGDLSGFTDGAAASDWAAEALAWAVGSGLLQGNDDGTLNPSGTATRAEIATILMRFCENIAK